MTTTQSHSNSSNEEQSSISLQKRARIGRNRSLKQMNQRFGASAVSDAITGRLRTEKIVRILEIGFGEGRVLMEVRLLFPYSSVLLYGINHQPEPTMSCDEHFLDTSEAYNICPRSEAAKLPLPHSYFYDAGSGLDFEDNFFDVIISQVSFPFVVEKAFLIEEIWRTLKPGGKALIHLDSYENDYPHMLSAGTNREMPTPRFVIYRHGRIFAISHLFNLLKTKGFAINLVRSSEMPPHSPRPSYTESLMKVDKNRSERLSLGLELDRISTLDLKKVRADESMELSRVYWGVMSVFNLTV
jgi:SAM-dependent methyltransferase